MTGEMRTERKAIDRGIIYSRRGTMTGTSKWQGKGLTGKRSREENGNDRRQERQKR